jgi:hypothetical protein
MGKITGERSKLDPNDMHPLLCPVYVCDRRMQECPFPPKWKKMYNTKGILQPSSSLLKIHTNGSTLMNNIADANIINHISPASQIYRLHCLKKKLKNFLTTDLPHDIEASMPIGLSNKYGRIFFIKLVSHTCPDKEAHKRIIYEYTLKLEITESNNMEGFQRELRRHIKQCDVIKGNKWKKITNHIIRQYQKIDSPPFNTGFIMLFITSPAKTQTKYGWLCTLLEWTNTTCHDLITPNLWPKSETTTSQELNTMYMHDKQWDTDGNSSKSNTTTEKTKPLPDSSTKQTTPRSISTAATADRSNSSYDPYVSTHFFTKVNIDAPKPTYNIWIVTSHVLLPTFW